MSTRRPTHAIAMPMRELKYNSFKFAGLFHARSQLDLVRELSKDIVDQTLDFANGHCLRVEWDTCGRQIEWIPGHAVTGNELADSWVVDEARREERMGGGPRSRGRDKCERGSLAFLKVRRKKDAVREWREEIVQRCSGSRAGFPSSSEGYRRNLRHVFSSWHQDTLWLHLLSKRSLDG